MKLSVVICTHDPRSSYLARVLDELRRQSLAMEFWELILVDNASSTALSTTVDLSWQPNARHIRENLLGLVHARRTGILASRTQVIVFVDDDNVLDRDYLEQALAISIKWPILGAWGGAIRPVFEVEPPEWTKPYWPLLAIRNVTGDKWSNLTNQGETAPCGAGMCVRAVVALKYAELLTGDPRRNALGRRGAILSANEDTDLAFVACDLGLGTAVFGSLQMAHLIPAARLEEGYLLRLVEGIHYSGVVLKVLRGFQFTRESRSQRLYNSYIRLRLDARARRFYDAIARGKTAAIAETALWRQ